MSQGVAVCNCLPKTAWPPDLSDSVVTEVKYINFESQYMGTTAFFCPLVTRPSFYSNAPLVPLQAGYILTSGLMSGRWLRRQAIGNFDSVRILPLSGVEMRCVATYSASRISYFDPIDEPGVIDLILRP